MRIVHKKTNKVIASQVRVANTFLSRLKGLMFIKQMKGFDAMLIENTNSVHNCFVRFSIDLIFINSEWKIVKIVKNFRPWRFSWIYFKARHVLELPAGSVGDEIQTGDYLEAQGV
ncbi:MAG: hypothetical protein CME64_13810 [Halobacteriovoraceae bacterium]|nr:hypothetical protein [Halobacteriovoraceae bacterium]|tara:strand:- start:30600 stop:30944 length:345 start_codon:yes stop_codon:yes gene_type:complete